RASRQLVGWGACRGPGRSRPASTQWPHSRPAPRSTVPSCVGARSRLRSCHERTWPQDEGDETGSSGFRKVWLAPWSCHAQVPPRLMGCTQRETFAGRTVSHECHAFAEPGGNVRTQEDTRAGEIEYRRTLEEPAGHGRDTIYAGF